MEDISLVNFQEQIIIPSSSSLHWTVCPPRDMVRFEQLPVEILQLVCEYVEDVTAFALVNKTCLSAAISKLYARIKITCSETKQLHADVDWWRAKLLRSQSFHHVRSLELVPAPDPVSINWYIERLRDHDDEGLNRKWQLHGGVGEVIPGSEQDRAWAPVADLIRHLPALAELHYACAPQLTACLLDAIESKQGCRLHLNSFRLHSLHQKSPKATCATPYEQRLAASSHIHSIISTYYETINAAGQTNYLEDAARSMTSGLTPNLKSVSLHYLLGRSSPARLDAYRRPYVRWLGTELGKKPGENSKGSLTSLELVGRPLCRLSYIKRWATVTDFSKLETLKIRDHVGVEILKWLTTEVDLSSLRSLVLTLSAFQDHQHDEVECFDWDSKEAELCQHLVQFLITIPPLRTLELSEAIDHLTLGRIMQYHGATLHKLVVFRDQWRKSYGDKFIDLAKEKWMCSSLKELAISSWRSNGDEDEIEQYTWLGSAFPDLRRLRLFVDCRYLGTSIDEGDFERVKDLPDIHRIPKPQLMYASDENGNELVPKEDPNSPEGKLFDLRYMLRNYAIDDKLAQEIYWKIASSKPAGSPPLESLRLRVRKDYSELSTYPTDFEDFCKVVLGKSWLCTLDLADQRRQRIIMKEVFFHDPDIPTDKTDWHERALEIFHSQWPKQPGKDWQDCWHSYPLVKDDE